MSFGKIESFKNFGGHRVKWWSLKNFAKLHGNDHLFIDIFQYYKFKHIF